LFPVSPQDDAKIIDYGDIGHASHNVWATLYSFCVDRNSCQTLHHIAGLIRDHADWFELPNSLRRREREEWSDFTSCLERQETAFGWSFSYNSAFEREARDNLHWSLLPNAPCALTSSNDASAASAVMNDGGAEGNDGKFHPEPSTEPPNLRNLQPGHTIVVANVCYSIVDKLGVGCWAVVYEAVSGGTRVAIKCMHPGVCAGQSTNKDMQVDLAVLATEFDREVAQQRRVAGLGVAPVIIDIDAGNRVIVMEYLHKSEYTLMSEILPVSDTNGALSETQQLELLRGLAKLKRANITCRDTNFLINVFFPMDPKGSVKIIDYGSVGGWNGTNCVWITLFHFLTQYQGLFQLNRIAGMLRDHPHLFNVYKPYVSGSVEEAMHFYNRALTSVTEEKTGGVTTSFEYSAGFEAAVRRILQTCNHAVRTIDIPNTIGMEERGLRMPLTVTRFGRKVFVPTHLHTTIKHQTDVTSSSVPVSGVKRKGQTGLSDALPRVAKRARVCAPQ
jgi:hypothetical protein